MADVTDLTGQRFGRLTVIDRGGTLRGYAVWVCKCDCGVLTEARGDRLRNGRRTSCGDRKKHPLGPQRKYKTRGEFLAHESWVNIRRRCLDPETVNFHKYGGRGITICERWQESFENFFADMGERPSARHSIDRIDTRGNYEPGNCRWATTTVQNLNRVNTKWIEIDGQQRKLWEVIQERGLEYHLVAGRLKIGWSVEKALSTPKRVPKKSRV